MLLFFSGMLVGAMVAGVILAIVAAVSEYHEHRKGGDSDGEC